MNFKRISQTDDEDVFYSDGEEVDFKSFEKATRECYVRGYHDGMDAGIEAKRQQGKDDGLKIGLQTAVKIGKLKGKLKAVVCHINLSSLTVEEDDLKRLNEAETALENLQDKLKASLIPESKNFDDILNHFDNIVSADLKSIIDNYRAVVKKLNIDESILD
ncbi:hypothetical protein CHUAL_006477 [Chamberlinius hualienensis]